MNATRFLSRDEAPEYLADRGLRISKQTLAKYAVTGGGPAYRLFGSRVVYDPADLEAWITARLTKVRRSTSEVV
jgi:Helix-turn-helix domain